MHVRACTCVYVCLHVTRVLRRVFILAGTYIGNLWYIIRELGKRGAQCKSHFGYGEEKLEACQSPIRSRNDRGTIQNASLEEREERENERKQEEKEKERKRETAEPAASTID